MLAAILHDLFLPAESLRAELLSVARPAKRWSDILVALPDSSDMSKKFESLRNKQRRSVKEHFPELETRLNLALDLSKQLNALQVES